MSVSLIQQGPSGRAIPKRLHTQHLTLSLITTSSPSRPGRKYTLQIQSFATLPKWVSEHVARIGSWLSLKLPRSVATKYREGLILLGEPGALDENSWLPSMIIGGCFH